MRLKTLAASIAFALFSTVASAQTVTVHSGGLGDFTNLYDARDAVLADPASPDVIEILDEGPFIGPNITFNDTPVLTEGVWVQPYNISDLTIRGAEGVRPILASTASSRVFTLEYVFGKVTFQNLLLTAAVPNEDTGSNSGPQGAILFAATVPSGSGLPGVGHHTTTGRPMNIVIDDVIITSSYVTFTGEGENRVVDQLVPATTDGITVAGINAPAPEGELCTIRLEAINVFSTSQALVNRLQVSNTVISHLPRAAYGIRTFFDGGPGTEIIVGPNVVASYITGAQSGASVPAGALQIGGNDGAPHILKVRGTPEQPIILHGNSRGVLTTGSTPVGSIKSFENVLITDSLYESFQALHPTENYIFNNVTIANGGQSPILGAEPFIFGTSGSNGNWGGSLIATNAIIAGNGNEDLRNLISVGSEATPPGFAEFTDSAIVLNGTFKLSDVWGTGGFDGQFPSDITLTDVINSDPAFISTIFSAATLNNFYRAGSSAYSTAGVDGAYGAGTPIAPDSVTVHSDGVTGDYSTIQAAINAVMGNPLGVGTVTILDEGPFIQTLISIPGGSLDEFVIRGAPGVRPIIAGSSASSVIETNNFYGRVVMENLLFTSATENGPVRGINLVMTGPNQVNAGTGIDYVINDVIIAPSWRIPGSPDTIIPVTTDGINFVSDPGGGAVFCNIRQEGINSPSNGTAIVNRMEFKNLVIASLPGQASPMSYGIRSFFDGAEGTELIVGPNVVISHLTGTVSAVASALQIGGNDGAAHILKVRGTVDEPVFLHANTRGVAISGSTPASSTKSFRHMLISDSVEEGFQTSHPTENYVFESVTIVNSGKEAFAFGTFPATNWNGSITGSNVILAGNGSEDERNVVRTYSEVGGIATLADGAVVLDGDFSLTGNGFTAPDPTNVSQTNILNSDPQFISTTFGDPGFYRPGATAYVSAGVLGPYGLAPLPPAHVTVHSDGVTGDFATIQAAVTAVMASDSSKVTVEILDEGPFVQGLIQVAPNSISVNDFTIRGADGVKPIIAGTANDHVLQFNHFYGKISVENLILTGAVPNAAGNVGPVRAVQVTLGGPEQLAAGRPLDITFSDVVITSSILTGGGDIIPLTTDGITVAGVNGVPLPSGDLCTVRTEAMNIGSSSTAFVNRLEFSNSVISALPRAGHGFRTFFDGAEGSEIVVGPNVVISYVTGVIATGGAVQVGGNEGANHILKVKGTPENPILIHGNYRGVDLTNTTLAASTKSFENVLISDSIQEGFRTGDLTESYLLRNVTIVNSGTGTDGVGSPAFTHTATGWSGTVTAENVIFAGDGSGDGSNVVNFLSSSTGTASVSDSAVVLNGSFSLTGNGIVASDPSNVTTSNILNSDPQFISTVFGNPDFYRAGSAAYSAAEVSGAYGSTTVEPEPVLGDLNGDMIVNVADVTALALAVAAGTQGELDKAVADVNGDDVVNEADVEALALSIVN
jgi:hypothetical protein